MKITIELLSPSTLINLKEPISFNRFRVLKAFLNTNGMNHTNNQLLFTVNNLTDAAIYNPSQSDSDYDMYSFSITAPVNQVIGYDRLMNNWDYDSSVETKTKALTIYITNNLVNLTFGANTKISIELEFE